YPAPVPLSLKDARHSASEGSWPHGKETYPARRLPSLCECGRRPPPAWQFATLIVSLCECWHRGRCTSLPDHRRTVPKPWFAAHPWAERAWEPDANDE